MSRIINSSMKIWSNSSRNYSALQNDYIQGKKEYTPPPRDPSFLGLSPDPEVTEQKKNYGVYPFPGKTREKGIHHRSGKKKGIHHRASDPEKEKRGVSTVVVYTFFFPDIPTFYF